MPYGNLLKGRVSLSGQIYFVTTVTENRVAYFADFSLARTVIDEMRKLGREGFVQSLAWVLMPDHLHWLLQLGEGKELSKVLRLFKGRSARRINEALQRNGPVWQKAFYDHAVRKEEAIEEIVKYVIANPIRKGLASRIEDYPLWDSIYL
jgi:REP element-mobilizing transposase RayT